jgi:hypothetical protein
MTPSAVFPNGNWPPSLGGGDSPFLWTLGANRRIGVSTQSLSKQLADYFGVKDGGALITCGHRQQSRVKSRPESRRRDSWPSTAKRSRRRRYHQGSRKKETGDVTLTIMRDHNQRTGHGDAGEEPER